MFNFVSVTNFTKPLINIHVHVGLTCLLFSIANVWLLGLNLEIIGFKSTEIIGFKSTEIPIKAWDAM